MSHTTIEEALAYAERLEKITFEGETYYIHPEYDSIACNVNFKIIRKHTCSGIWRQIKNIVIVKSHRHAGVTSTRVNGKTVNNGYLIADCFIKPITGNHFLNRVDTTMPWAVDNIARTKAPRDSVSVNYLVTKDNQITEITGAVNLLNFCNVKQTPQNICWHSRKHKKFTLNGCEVTVL